MSGKIIVIEGTDCSGKETQTKLLEKRLKVSILCSRQKVCSSRNPKIS